MEGFGTGDSRFGSGGLGESETAGLVMNVVPKTGGNELHGAVFFSGTGADLQADNGSGTPPTK